MAVLVPDRLLEWLLEEQQLAKTTDAALAARIGVSASQLSNLRAGRRRLTRDRVEALCQRDPALRKAYIHRCLVGPGEWPGPGSAP
jgi:transcriptional regulator with XRE-family HTH domain